VPLTITSPPSTSSGVSAVAVAVPVVIAIVLIGLAGFCVWARRRHGSWPLIGALARAKRSSSQGYGVRQSHGQRTGTGLSASTTGKGGAGIQLTPTESWSPTSGRNVFREEIRRQDTGGRV
jgi:hypothetical protein